MYINIVKVMLKIIYKINSQKKEIEINLSL